LVCWSNDMEYPAPDVEDPVAVKCSECSKGTWNDRKLECKPSVTYIFLNVTDGIPAPFTMTFRATGLREFNKFHKSMQAKLKRATNRGQGINNLAIDLSTKTEKGKKGSYHVPVFSLTEVEKGEAYSSLVDTYRQLLANWDYREKEQQKQAVEANTPTEEEATTDQEDDKEKEEVGEKFDV